MTTTDDNDDSARRPEGSDSVGIAIERVQIGARMEKRLVKVLRALAEYHDMTLGDLLEGIVLHVFDNRLPFDEDGLRRIAQLKLVYGVDYDASASHHFTETTSNSERHSLHQEATHDSPHA